MAKTPKEWLLFKVKLCVNEQHWSEDHLSVEINHKPLLFWVNHWENLEEHFPKCSSVQTSGKQHCPQPGWPGSMRTQLGVQQSNGVIPRVPRVTVHTSHTALAPLRCSPWLPTHTFTSELANSFPPLWLRFFLGHFIQIKRESLQVPEQCNCKQVDNSVTVLNLSLASLSLMANVPEDEKPGSAFSSV